MVTLLKAHVSAINESIKVYYDGKTTRKLKPDCYHRTRGSDGSTYMYTKNFKVFGPEFMHCIAAKEADF